MKKKKETRKVREAAESREDGRKKRGRKKKKKTKKKRKIVYNPDCDIVTPVIPRVKKRKLSEISTETEEPRGKIFSPPEPLVRRSSTPISFECNISNNANSFMTSSDSSMVESIERTGIGYGSPGDPRAIFEDSVAEDIQDAENTPALLCLQGRGVTVSSEKSKPPHLNLVLSPVPKLVMDDVNLITPRLSFGFPSSRSSRGEESRHQRRRPLDDAKSPDLIMRPMPTSPTDVDITARRFVNAVNKSVPSNPQLSRVLEYIKDYRNISSSGSVSDTIHKIKSLLSNHKDLHVMFDTYVSVWGMSGLNVESSSPFHPVSSKK